MAEATYLPPPSFSERKATLLRSGENDGSRSSAASVVKRLDSPLATFWIQTSRLPAPARSEA